MDTIDVLHGVQRFDDAQRVYRIWKRELHQDAVVTAVCVQAGNGLQQFLFRGILLQAEHLAEDTHLCAGTLFVADVNTGGWVIAHQHSGQPRRHAVLLLHLQHTLGHLRPKGLGCLCAVQNFNHACLRGA